MGKKDNTLLWIIAGCGLGWLLAPKALKEQITSGIPSIGIDLSGLLGGGVGQAPLDLGSLLGVNGILPEFEWPKFEWPAFPESPLLDYTGIIQDILDAGNTAAEVVGKAASDAANMFSGGDEEGGDPAPTPPKVPGVWEEFTELHPIVKNVLAGVAGVGGVYGAVKVIQAVAPATRITTGALASTFERFLRGRPPVTKVSKPPITGLKKPPGVPSGLWRQWMRYTGLGKWAGRAGLGLAPLGIMDIIQQFDPTKGIEPIWKGWFGEEPADVTIPWTSKTWKMKPQPEDRFTRKEPEPMRAEREYMPKKRKVYGPPEPFAKQRIEKPKKYTTDLYKPALEGVQW